MGRPSPRILVQAGLVGVFFAARILRGEIPRYRLPLPEFAANFYTRSCLLIHDKMFVWIQKKESQGCHTAGNLSTIGFLLYDSALCLDPHMENSLTDFVYRAL